MRADPEEGAGRTLEANAPDAIERWGRRLGRTLGVCFLVVLIINLFTHWFF
jgi:hypothetical protein